MAAGDALSRTQRARVDEVTRGFLRQTGVHISVFLGDVDGDVAAFADQTLNHALIAENELVLVVVAPGQRQVEIRTTPSVHPRLSDQACALAALSMTTSFGVGDLIGGLLLGIRMLADALAPAATVTGRPPSTSSTSTTR